MRTLRGPAVPIVAAGMLVLVVAFASCRIFGGSGTGTQGSGATPSGSLPSWLATLMSAGESASAGSSVASAEPGSSEIAVASSTPSPTPVPLSTATPTSPAPTMPTDEPTACTTPSSQTAFGSPRYCSTSGCHE